MAIEAILVNENKPTPLSLALSRLDIKTYKNMWAPSAEVLDSISACFISFYDCISHPLRVLRLRQILRQRNIPLIAWNRDAPGYMNKAKWQLDLLERAQLIDIYLSHAFPDDRQFAKTQVLLHNAAQVEIYNLNGVSLEQLEINDDYIYDVTFFGAIDGSRYKEYEKRQSFFSQLSSALISQGISFNFIDTLKTPLTASQQVRLIQTSRINLNFDAGCEYGYASGFGLPERCFGIPACGGFLLSDFRSHAEDAFEMGSEWAHFHDLTDAVEKIKYYLSDFDKTRRIARNAHARVMRDHTYQNRARHTLDIIEQWNHANNKTQ